MNTDTLTILRSEVARRLATMDFRLTALSDFDAAALITLAGERLAAQAALDMIDAQLSEGEDDEAE